MLEDEKAIWGFIFIGWIAVSFGPTLYANLTYSKVEGSSDWFIKWVGGPWTLGFVGLMVIWAMELPLSAGLAYSLVSAVAYAFWVLHLRRSSRGSGSNELEQPEASDDRGVPTIYRFSKIQRAILIAAATAMILMLMNQADRYGLDETPWITGVLAITALLSVAFARRKT